MAKPFLLVYSVYLLKERVFNLKKYQKLGIGFIVFVLFIIGIVVVVQAKSKEEMVFDTTEDKDSLIDTIVASEQVKEIRYAELKKIRLEEERVQKEAEEAEKKRLAEERKRIEEEQARIAEENRLAEEAKIAKEAEQQKEVTVASEVSAPVEQEKVEAPAQSSNVNGTNLGTFQATAYTAYDGTQIGITRGGTNMANGNIHTASGHRIIAADPSVIPFGSIVRITLSSGEVINGKVDDTGGAINGNIIDISFASTAEAYAFGRQTVQLEIIN